MQILCAISRTSGKIRGPGAKINVPTFGGDEPPSLGGQLGCAGGAPGGGGLGQGEVAVTAAGKNRWAAVRPETTNGRTRCFSARPPKWTGGLNRERDAVKRSSGADQVRPSA